MQGLSEEDMNIFKHIGMGMSKCHRPRQEYNTFTDLGTLFPKMEVMHVRGYIPSYPYTAGVTDILTPELQDRLRRDWDVARQNDPGMTGFLEFRRHALEG